MKQILSFFIAFTTLVTFGQELSKERFYEAKKLLREGNTAYEKNEFDEAMVAYQKSLAQNGNYYKGAFNLANTFYKLKNYPEAEKFYNLAKGLVKTDENKAKLSEALGDNYSQQKKFDDAIKSYKEALLKSPDNDILRQKFVAAKRDKKKQEEQQQKDKSNKDDKDQDEKNKDDNKDNKDDKDGEKDKDGDQKKKDDSKDGDDKKDDKGEKEKDKDGDEEEKSDKKDPENKEEDSEGSEEDENQEKNPGKSKLSKDQIEQLLESMSNEEEKTQKKVNASQTKMNRKRNEKDW